jgi:large subunit ribosomal protein L18
MSKRDRIRKKHTSIRKKVKGTTERPRLSVYRSLMHYHLQIIDDEKQITIVSASTAEKTFKDKVKTVNKSGSEAAKLIGQEIAKRALEKDIKKVVFDRGGFKFSKNLKTLADSARETGLEF